MSKLTGKRWILPSILLVSLVLTAFMPMHVRAEEDFYVKKTLKISGESFGRTSGKAKVEQEFDLRWIATEDIHEYNPKLASFASVLSTAIYGADSNLKYAKVTIKGEKGNNSDPGWLLNRFGFSEAEAFTVEPSGPYDNDRAFFVIGHRLDRIEDRDHDTYVVVIEGTSGTEQWMSNFDMGYESENSEANTPDWTNHKNHKGFDVTATRILRQLQDFIEAHNTESSERSVLFTGHSRGAAIANILGAKYDGRSVAYTFASPNTTKVSEKKASSYKSIFNIINSDDIVSSVPLRSFGFRRYGKDISYSIRNNKELREMVEDLRGLKRGELERSGNSGMAVREAHYTVATFAIVRM